VEGFQEALSELLCVGVVRVALDHLVERRHRSLEVALSCIDLRERHRRQRRRSGRSGSSVSDARGPTGLVQPAIDHAREEIARAAEPAAPLLVGAARLAVRLKDLVDELRDRQRAWPHHPHGLRLRDQLFAREPLQILPLHGRDPITIVGRERLSRTRR